MATSYFFAVVFSQVKAVEFSSSARRSAFIEKPVVNISGKTMRSVGSFKAFIFSENN